MTINGAWLVETLPYHYVIDVTGIGLRLAYITPCRTLVQDDLTPYHGYHPRKLRGIPMPEYYYPLYGLNKSKETASEVVYVRLTPTDKATIEKKARSSGVSVSEYIRNTSIEGGQS